MTVAGGAIAAAIVLGLLAVAGGTLRSKWRRDEDLFDGSPRVVVPEQGGPVRTDMLVRLAFSKGYTLAGKQETAEPPGTELVFVRSDR